MPRWVWLFFAWFSILATALSRVVRRQRAVEQTVRRAIVNDRAYRGAGRIVRIVPGPTSLSIGRVPLGHGQHGFGVMRLVAMAFDLRGEGFVMHVDAGAKLRVISHAATFENGVASVPLGTKMVLLVPIADGAKTDEPITLVDPRIDLLRHLNEIRAVSRARMAGVVAAAVILVFLAAYATAIPGVLLLAVATIDQLVAEGALMWTLCSTVSPR